MQHGEGDADREILSRTQTTRRCQKLEGNLFAFDAISSFTSGVLEDVF